ncbi:MAG: phosphotyrosine protein phosphatase [Candidatus Woesearchaeota archaeon]|jgi:protein-tyrosine phosphatase|nr:phosphotyrosine protein phosphatase [Candidatus Woesearchaeota archaeon]MDP7324480.1 phosphotyrosine protein phosphatase [Candidatus Woesearchaeota archaeon]MDP7457299.1 phosphotyrosine protein phosphatase [Candidatus Woesearchaeota archaeon]|tara:strand:- start:161 stop:484 length:324 start_codon:yes stop_codon:yes gene_type:complete
MKVLFICNQNLHRSKTAEKIFSSKFETKSAGLYNEKPVNEKQVSWADLVVVMEDQQRKELSVRFPKQYLQKQIISLNLPDIYNFEDAELITKLKSKVNRLIQLTQII